MNSVEREVRDLLKAAGAKFERRAGKGGEVYKLPNGATFICSDGAGQRRGNQNQWVKSLGELRRIVGKIDPSQLSRVADAALASSVSKFVTMSAAAPDIAHTVAADQHRQTRAFVDETIAKLGTPYMCPICQTKYTREGDARACRAGCVAQRDAEEKAANKKAFKDMKAENERLDALTKEKDVKVIQMKQTETPKQQELPLKEKPIEPAPAPSKRGRNIAPGTHWTPEQDRVVIEGYEAGFTLEEIAKLLQDVRPGATEQSVASRASDLRARYKALGQARGPGGRPTAPITPKPAPVVQTPPVPAPAGIVAIAGPIQQPARLAKVTFEIGGKTRVVEVDEATARQMLSRALEL